MNKIVSKQIPIRKLLNYINQKKFAIPEIQREFVWNLIKASNLIDSIYKNYPIGTIIIWETNKNNQNMMRHTQNVLPAYDDKANKDIWFIIDGQQRLTVLYQIMKGAEIKNANGKNVNFSKINISIQQNKSVDDVTTTKQLDTKSSISVHEILNQQLKYKFKNLKKSQLKIVKDYKKNLLNYKINTILLKTDNLDEIRETFIRINSQGTPIGKADRIFTRATQFKLRHLVNGLIQDFVYGFNAIPKETILTTIALANGAKDIGERFIQAKFNKIETEESDRKYFDRSWPILKQAIYKAVVYLNQHLGVVDYNFLPSQNMVVVLSLFFFYNRNGQPKTGQKKEIKKWYWYTALAQRYAGSGYRKNILSDVEFFKKLADNKNKKFKISEKLSLSILNTDYSKKSSIVDAYFCLLVLQKPRFFDNGDHFTPEWKVPGNKKHKHHIFPKNLLQRKGFSKKQYNNICNICFLVTKDHGPIKDKHPMNYLKDIKSKKYFPSIMKSHLIPHSSSSGLWNKNVKKGYRMFINERKVMVYKAFNQCAGVKLFKKDDMS